MEDDVDQIPHTQGLLSSIFGGDPEESEASVFAHPHEMDILVKAIEILKESNTGAHLLGVLNEKNLGVRVIKNRVVHGYTPDYKIIYLGVPPDLKQPDALSVLELAAGIREIEQNLLGFTVPDDDDDPLLAAQARHAKYLDIIVYMCKIAIELEICTGTTKYVDAVEKLGHGNVLQAYVTESGDDELIAAYAKAHDKVQ